VCAEKRKKERKKEIKERKKEWKNKKHVFLFPPRRDSPCVPERIRRRRSSTDRDGSLMWCGGEGRGGRLQRRLRWHVPLPPTLVGRQVRPILSVSVPSSPSPSISLSLSLTHSALSFLHARATTFFIIIIIIIIFPRVGRRIIIIIFYYNHDRVRPRTRTSRPYNTTSYRDFPSSWRVARCVLLLFFSNIIFPYGKTYAAAAAIYR